MNITAFLLVLLAGYQSAPDKPRTHSPESLFFTEVPDLPALLAAYEQAPLLQLIGDEKVQASIQALLDSAGMEIGPAVSKALADAGVPVEIAGAPLAAARGVLDQIQSASMSVSLAADPEQLAGSIENLAACLLELRNLNAAIAEHTADHDGFPPSSLEGLGLPEDRLLDPWGNAYRYEVELGSLEPRLFSLGADAAPGGAGFNSDFEAGAWGPEQSEQLVHEIIQVLAEVEFREAKQADEGWMRALDLIGQSGWTTEVREDLGNAAPEGRVCILRDPGVEGREAWLFAVDRSLIAGYGASALEALLERRRSETVPSSPIATLAGHLEPPRGSTVVQGWIQLGRLIQIARDLESTMGEGNSATHMISFPEESLFRLQLDEGRFISEYVNSPFAPNAPDAPDAPNGGSVGWSRLQHSLGYAPIDASLWDYMPSQAIGLIAMSFDAGAVYEELLRTMGATPEEPPERLRDIEERFGFDIGKDLFGSLGDSVGGYLLPITGVITIPGIALVVELDDAESFQRGIDGLLRLLEEQAGGDFSVRYKPYRDQPMWSFSFGQRGGGSGMMGPITLSPSLAIVENHLLVTLTSARAKKEVKRILKEERVPHPMLAMTGAPPAEAGAVAYLDWSGAFNGIYEGGRAALALFGGMAEDLPFDPGTLPDAETFSRFFEPTVMWSITDEAGFSKTHSESSFGPETALAVIGGGGAMFLGLQPRLAQAREPAAPMEPTEVEIETTTETKQVGNDPALEKSTRSRLNELATRLEVYRIETGRYPQALGNLLEPTPSYPRGFVPAGVLPVDAWGHDFVYAPKADGAAFSLWSVGSDGADGGGEGDDIRLN